VEDYDQRYYATYYAIDAINFETVESRPSWTRSTGLMPWYQGSRGITARSVVRGSQKNIPATPVKGCLCRKAAPKPADFNRRMIDEAQRHGL